MIAIPPSYDKAHSAIVQFNRLSKKTKNSKSLSKKEIGERKAKEFTKDL